MITQVGICNLALSHIGQASITAMEENSEQAKQCSIVYDSCRDALLRSCKWKFANKKETLAQISDEQVVGWRCLYKYPAKALFVHRIFCEASARNSIAEEFDILLSPEKSQKAIAADLEPAAYVEYTIIATDPNQYDANFVEALSFEIAAKVARALNEDKQLVVEMEQLAAVKRSEAMRINASEGYMKQVKTSSYEDVR